MDLSADYEFLIASIMFEWDTRFIIHTFSVKLKIQTLLTLIQLIKSTKKTITTLPCHRFKSSNNLIKIK